MVDKISLDQTVNYIDEAIPHGELCHIVLVNAAKVVKAKFDPDLASIIKSADLVGADGVPIVWASKILGQALPGRVNGTDLMERLFELANRRGYKLYLLGAKEEIISKTVQELKKRYQSIQIAGYRNGYFDSLEEEKQAVRDIAASGADILLVGMGSPMKEKWVRRNKADLGVPIIHGVGGSFDIIGGLTKRAPVWMQKYGLEWFFRLCQEPRRMWKRYLFTNTVYVALVIKTFFERIAENNKKLESGK
ncbi:WecB/TagA/CpsF family glycosyltransferase [candidate division KSB1 bacterium]|nr:WecB/TagA/CpsF family glycosyltransferase [candidate division KSB1 bacterium]